MGYLAIWTDKIYSAIAILIGILCGVGVLLFTGGKRGIPAQIIAVLTSVLGILIGTFVFFFHSLKKDMAEPALNIFSEYVLTTFFNNIYKMFGVYEAIFLLIAIVIAWSIPQPSFKK